MQVFNPIAPCYTRPQDLRKTLDHLQGKVIGFIDNAKPNFNFLVDDLAELLVSRYGVGAVVKRRKSNSGSAAPEAVFSDIVEQCDAVITGSGD